MDGLFLTYDTLCTSFCLFSCWYYPHEFCTVFHECFMWFDHLVQCVVERWLEPGKTLGIGLSSDAALYIAGTWYRGFAARSVCRCNVYHEKALEYTIFTCYRQDRCSNGYRKQA